MCVWMGERRCVVPTHLPVFLVRATASLVRVKQAEVCLFRIVLQGDRAQQSSVY